MYKNIPTEPSTTIIRSAQFSLLLAAAAFAPAALRAEAAPAFNAEEIPVEKSAAAEEKLSTVVVTAATRTERTLEEVPVRTEVLPRAAIDLRAPTNFSQALELINGVRVESNCQNCNTSEVQLLGLGGNYNQILFDGMPLLSSLGSVYGLEQLPSAFVDRIEVVKGGGSTLYGARAVAGVINVVAEEPLTNGVELSSTVESIKGTAFSTTDLRADYVFAEGRGGISLYGQFSQNDAVDYNGDGYSELTEKEQQLGGFQLWFRATDTTKIKVNYQYLDEERRGGNRLDQAEYLANIAESLATQYHRGNITLEQDLRDNLDLRLGYAFAYIKRDSFYGGLGNVVTDPSAPGYDPNELDPGNPGSAAETSYNQYGYTENPLHYFDSQLNWRLGDHALAFGIQYKYEGIRDENRNYLGQTLSTLTDDHYDNIGAFVQDEWTATDSLTFLGGIRVDKSSTLDNPILSPRLAATYDFAENWKLRGSISSGFRAPEVFSEDLHVDTLGATPVHTRNASGLREEKSLTYALGLDWKSDPVAPKWRADLTASLTDIRNTFAIGPIQTDPGTGELYQERTNASGSLVAGLEGNLLWQPDDKWAVSLGAAYYDSRFDDAQDVYDDGVGTVLSSRDYLKAPNWTAVAQVTWKPVDALETFAGFRYTGPMQVLNNNTASINRTRSFYVFDLGMVYHLDLGGNHLHLGAGVKNLFDQRQKDLESGADRDSDYVYGPRSGRTFYVSARLWF